MSIINNDDLPCLTRRAGLGLLMGAVLEGHAIPARAAATGQLNIGVHISLAPTWFDPGETPGLITPYLLIFALHDALIKPMREGTPGHSLAESSSMSADGLVHTFKLRQGTTFHDGSAVTAADVKYSFERYRGNSAALLKDRVASVATPDARTVVFTLKEPWPDFITFYTAATGANWVVPRAYVEKVGDAGFKKAPMGAGPYKFVSFEPGVELVLEAHEKYWRRPPAIKRIVMKVIPDEATRLVALKRGEIDIAYSIRGELAADAQRTPGLSLKIAPDGATYYLCFPEQWDDGSPWADVRVRRAVFHAIDYKSINDALCLGHCSLSANFVPRHLAFYWQPPALEYNPDKARQLLAEAGHPNGFDAGFYWCDSSYANLGEAAANNLAQIGIKTQLRPIERAAFDKGFTDKRYKKGIIQGSSAAFGNASTRLSVWAVKGGAYAYGSYPDIDAMYQQQLVEVDTAKRAAILERMQQLVYERHMIVNLWQLAFLNAVGPRVAESGIGLVKTYVYTGPYEDLALKSG